MTAWGRQRPTGPSASDLHRLGNCERIFELDSKVAHGAVHFRVTEQELHRPQVAGLPLNLRDCGSSHGMCAIDARLKSDGGYPLTDEPGILPRRDMQFFVESSRPEMFRSDHM